MSLARRLARQIATSGPVSIATYMDLCLHDAEFGYYATRPRLGARGDFITSPLVSQMVGELLGLWACEVFARLGRPVRPRLVELGPGDGTMMTDVLRAARTAAPEFVAACEIVMVETSGPLKVAQAAAMTGAGRPVAWIERFEDLAGDGPVIVLANEFLDCLPIEQAVWTAEGWGERRVGLDDRGRLAFAVGPVACARPGQAARIGEVQERSRATRALGAQVGGLIATQGGAALFLDYGEAQERPIGDTLQAVRGHGREHPLAHPGEADLTARVDFGAFLAAARAAGAAAAPLRSQGEFLRALGIEARAAALAAARPDRAEVIGRQLRRLTQADQMGELFKAACVHSAGLSPPGFESSA